MVLQIGPALAVLTANKTVNATINAFIWHSFSFGMIAAHAHRDVHGLQSVFAFAAALGAGVRIHAAPDHILAASFHLAAAITLAEALLCARVQPSLVSILVHYRSLSYS